MIEAVIDTNVIVAGLRSRQGYSFELIQRMYAGEFQPIVSVPLVFEYESLLTKIFVPQVYSGEDIEGVVDSLCSIAKKQDIYYLWRPMLKDPYDDHILELALAAGCKNIVTYNLKDFINVEDLGIRVIKPYDFIQFLEG